MIDNAAIVDVLNSLLAAERRSLLPQLLESSPFLDASTARTLDGVRRMENEEREHADWLTEAVVAHGGHPSSALPDPRRASCHYLELSYLLPTILRDKQRLIQRYQRAGERFLDAEARQLVDRIATRHAEHLAMLTTIAK